MTYVNVAKAACYEFHSPLFRIFTNKMFSVISTMPETRVERDLRSSEKSGLCSRQISLFGRNDNYIFYSNL